MIIDLKDEVSIRLLGELRETERLLRIMESGEAALRPAAAWSALVFGSDVEATIGKIAKQPVETNAEQALAICLKILRERRRRAHTGWRARVAQLETSHGRD
jgi:hypothetical protein